MKPQKISRHQERTIVFPGNHINAAVVTTKNGGIYQFNFNDK